MLSGDSVNYPLFDIEKYPPRQEDINETRYNLPTFLKKWRAHANTRNGRENFEFISARLG